MKEFKASDVKFLAAKEAGFSKSKVIPLEMSSNGVFIDYARFEVCGRIYTLLYNNATNKFMLDIAEGDF